MADLPPETDNLEELEEMLKGEGEGGQPSREKVLELMEANLAEANLTEEMKENLRAMLTGNVPKIFGGYLSGTLLALVFILIIFSILLFFGYKLYKSIKDKEVKREEKKKAKQMKKKK